LGCVGDRYLCNYLSHCASWRIEMPQP